MYYLSCQTVQVLSDKMHAVFGMKRRMSHLSHLLHLCIFYYIPDVMKSEERQKLAKERREEKAKYFGKCWRRAPPSGRAEAGGAEFPLC